MSKSGKLRQLIKELNTKYDDADSRKYFPQHCCQASTPAQASVPPKEIPSPSAPSLPRSVDQLRKEVVNLDQQFDSCQEVWVKGEANGFLNEELLVLIRVEGSVIFGSSPCTHAL